MKKKLIVISLGGSLIVQDKINWKFLNKFKRIIKNNTRKHKFIIICGGGKTARNYMSKLKTKHLQSLMGIASTRMNARFMSYFFEQDQEKGIPHTLETLKEYIKKKDIIFCGALEYKPNQTSDSTTANLAKYFKTPMINITNVDGLFNKDPRKDKTAKLISKITWKEFDKVVNKIKFKPGQHFVLDQTASRIIMKNKIKTYIIGENISNLNKILKSKKFKGTVIEG